jgi:hypothetical protein
VSRTHALAAAVIVVLALLLYAPHIRELGWYYDDWALAAAMQDVHSSSPVDLYDGCHAEDTGGRPGACAFHAISYWLLGSGQSRYHAALVAMLVLSALLFFALLRRLRVPWPPALLAASLLVVFPGSDTVRFWPTANNLQWALCLLLAGVLLGIEALRRRSLPLHVASLLVLFLTLNTYDGMLPLVAISGGLYWLAIREPRALRRGLVDLVMAVVFLGYRLTLGTPPDEEGQVVSRTLGELLSRELDILEGAWRTWRELFLPAGSLGITLLVATVAVAAGAWFARPVSRPVLRAASLAALVGIGWAAIAVSAYLTTADLYIPQPDGLFNRTNLGASLGYVAIFVALLVALYGVARALTGRTWAAAALPAVAVGALVVHQVDRTAEHRDAWVAAAQSQQIALNGFREAAKRVPPDARVMSFGHPIWEKDFIPVFAARWDLRGALDYETRIDSPDALPFFPGTECSPTGVTLQGGQGTLPYRSSTPLWFINGASAQALPIRSMRRCEETVAAWGVPPFWGPSVTS